MDPAPTHADNGFSIEWNPSGLQVKLSLDESGAPCLDSLTPKGRGPPENVSPHFSSARIPINAVRVNGLGHSLAKTSKSLIGGVLSGRLRYQRHVERATDKSSCLDVVSADSLTGVEVTHTFEVFHGAAVLRSSSTIRNTSAQPITVSQLSSLAIGGLTAGVRDWHTGYSVWEANNTWFREAQWQERSLPDVGIDEVGLLALNQGHTATMASYHVSKKGSMSTEGHLSMGAVTRRDGSDTWLWQVEHNGSWRWEIGDWKDGLYLTAGGPTYLDHDWTAVLAPGQVFQSVPVALCHTAGALEDAFSVLNDYRRCLLPPCPDHQELPIIFNDYMNCLMGDPTEDKIKALLDPAKGCGAKYFVIDAGWYADDNDWWDDVGAWLPSSKRFPSGFDTLIDTIKAKGLIPGLWLEPEVVGIRSSVAKSLPEHAFFQQHGHRLEERSRYSLDFSQIEVRDYLDSVIQRLVESYGIGYFKFDYNIDVSCGSDTGVLSGRVSTGAAHLAHQRAYLGWVQGLIHRFPGLVIENCASGGQRMEYASLSVHTLQSTSDQQDPFLYASVAAACPTAVVPEQSASWAYPQKDWSDETNAFTVVNSLLGRVHLSGRLDNLNPGQYELIREGMRVYREDVRDRLRDGRPFWPLGLPRWHDDWVSLGFMFADDTAILAVWRRNGPTSARLPLPASLQGLRGASVLYPSSFEADVKIRDGNVEVQLPPTPCARLLRLSNH